MGGLSAGCGREGGAGVWVAVRGEAEFRGWGLIHGMAGSDGGVGRLIDCCARGRFLRVLFSFRGNERAVSALGVLFLTDGLQEGVARSKLSFSW